MASPTRREGEDFKKFKARQKIENRMQKLHLRSVRMLWNVLQRGTYWRKRDGELC